MIDICLLGCSALLPLPDRALTSATLSCSGHTILFDCGEGTQTAIRKQGVSPLKIDLIALTHYHGDHCFGLPGLMQTMFCMGRTTPLYLLGPAGLTQALSPILQLAGELSFTVHLLEAGREPLRLSDLICGWPSDCTLSAFPTKHRTISQGYCFLLERPGKFLPEKAQALQLPVSCWSQLQRGECVEIDGRTIFPQQVMGAKRKGLKFIFSGDTSPCESLLSAATNADLMICEATYGDPAQAELALSRGHMTFSMASDCAAKAGVSRLWLTHYSQLVKAPEVYLPLAKEIFPNTECGFDGKKLRLFFEA